METDYKQKISELARILARSYPKLPYHNFDHALDVWSVARGYSMYHRFNDAERFVLESAALLHDVVYVVGANDNEEKSVNYSNRWLPMLGYEDGQIDDIGRLVLATKWPTKPKNLSEMIICDSDLDNLGREDFIDKSHLLMKEWNVPRNLEWYKKQLELLENNHYYTDIAKFMRNSGKEKNIAKLKELLKGYEGALIPGGIEC